MSQRSRRLRAVVQIGLLGLMLTLAFGAAPPRAYAGGVVGDGTPESCTEAAFVTALGAGGIVTFNCGPAPHTITLTSPKSVGTDTVIDGAELITLSGGDTTRLFSIGGGGTLTLNRITIANGFGIGDGGAIVNSPGGTLNINQSILRDNEATDGSGGAIVSYGPLTIADSQLFDNEANNGGAVYPRHGNSLVTIRNSVLRNNVTNQPRDGFGGAILLWDGVTMSIENSKLFENTARYGGAIYNLASVLTIDKRTVISGNRADLAGGGIYNTNLGDRGRTTILASSIQGNSVANDDGEGGAIFNQARLELEAATASGNQASYGGALSNYGTVEMTNSTLSGNSARQGGGVFNHEGGSTSLDFATLYANNASDQGGNLFAQFGGVSLHGSIIALGNCAGQPPSSHGNNLADSDTCSLTQEGDVQNTDPRLLSLENNDGPSATHLPLPDSPVIDAGSAGCPLVDQRGLQRPQGQACDIGAVEVLPGNASCGGTIDADADTTISSIEPDQAADGDAVLRIARDGEGETQALLHFDLAGRLPPQSTIMSATLELPILRTTSPVSDVLQVQGLRQSWGEGVTWNTRPAPQSSYGRVVAGLGIPFVQIDLTTLVTHWASGTVTETSVLLAPGLPVMDLLLRSSDDSSSGPKLRITCATAPAEIPADATAANQRQFDAFEQLESTSTQTLTLQIDRGAIRYASFDIAVPASVGSDSLAQAEWFLKTYADALRLDQSADVLQLIRRSEDERSLFFRQVHNSIPVYGAELVVHHNGNGRIDGLGGNYLPDITLSTQPTLGADEVTNLATTASPGDDEVLGDAQLRFFNGRLLGTDDDRTALVWQVNLRTTEGDIAFLVDAHTGAILFQESRHNRDYDLDLENGNNELPRDLCGLFDDDDVSANFSPDARRVADNMAATYNYWRNTFGRDSYDNDGEQIEVNVNVGGPPNASYMGCDIFTFSNGWTQLDIVSHEFSHAVDANEANLIYANQSGALDESFADIWGHFLDSADWRIGEDLAGGAIRDMSNPPAFGDPDVLSNYCNPGPADYCGAAGDSGGVHTNSGINNKAAFLITDGGTHNTFNVQGIGQANAQRLFHNVFTSCLWNSSQLIDARNCAVTEAQKLNLKVCSVRNAYAAVGLGQGDRDCDNIEDNVDPDADGDWSPDFRDNCLNLFNPGQNNVDGDAQGDDCDPDIDGDGVPNLRANGASWDNCRFVANPFQADADGDGEGDACDDRDGDGYIDVQDNCPNLFNNQSDVDSDRIGDACDPDIDNDGLANGADNCAYVANAGQENRDGDIFGDACDGCPDLLSNDNGDVDRDGRANPCDPDADNDGICNLGGPLTDLPGLLPTGCVAGPMLVHPEGADNCPLESNPGQIDRDKNGIGLSCDFAELQELMKSIKEYSDRYVFYDRNPLRIPIPICPQCTGPYLPNIFESRINVVLPPLIKARVVDSVGTVVARPQLINGITQLRFNPAPFAGNSLRLGLNGLSPAQGDSPAAADTNYYLELIPSPAIDPTQGYVVRTTITETPSATVATFLPLIRK